MLTILFLQFLLPLLPYLIPAMAGLGSAAMSAGAVNRMNRYNDPRAQLQRLNAAGLPFAAFAQGQAGSQSSLPDTSGVAEGINQGAANFMMNRMQKKQIELIDEQIKTQKALERKTWSDALFSHSQARVASAEADEKLSEYGSINEKPSNLAFLMGKEREIKELEVFTKKYDNEIKRIDSLFKSEAYQSGKLTKQLDAEIDGLLLRNDLARQQFKDNQTRTVARNEIIDRMKKNGLSVGEALVIQIMNALTGGLKSLN